MAPRFENNTHGASNHRFEDAHRAHELMLRALEWLRKRLTTGAEVAA